MSAYLEYLNEIEERKGQDLDPKPIDSAELLSEVIEQIKDPSHEPVSYTHLTLPTILLV